MLHNKNFRTLTLSLSYLCLAALLCLKVFIPLVHAQDYHQQDRGEISLSNAEHCLSCDLEHAAFVFALGTMEALEMIVSFLGVLIVLNTVLTIQSSPIFSSLRAPPVNA